MGYFDKYKTTETPSQQNNVELVSSGEKNKEQKRLNAIVSKLSNSGDIALVTLGSSLEGIIPYLPDNSTSVSSIITEMDKYFNENKNNLNSDFFRVFNGYIEKLRLVTKDYRLNIEKAEKESKEKQNEEKRISLRERIKELKEMQVIGTADMDDWEDFKEDLPLPKGVELNLEQLNKVEKLYGKMVESANKQVGYLREINYALDGMLDQLEDLPINHTGEVTLKVNDKGFFRYLGGLVSSSLSYGFDHFNYKDGNDFVHDFLPNSEKSENITFSSVEEAFETIKLWKKKLKEIENMDWGSVAKNILLTSFSALNTTNLFLLDFIYEDLSLIGENIMNPIGWGLIGLNWVIITKMKMFFAEASTGINLAKISEFDTRLGETIRLYESAGYMKGSDDLASIKEFRARLTKIAEQDATSGVVDTREVTRQVYKLLQDFKGNVLIDKVCFGLSNVGEFMKGDGEMLPGKTLGLYDKKQGNFKLGKFGWVLDKFIRAYIIAPRWLTIGINRGIGPGYFGWRFKTSSGIIYEAVELTGDVNKKFKRIFSIIDQIEGLNPSEKTKLKGRIMENYRGSLPGDRLNPFQKYKLDFSKLKRSEVDSILNRVNSILVSEGKEAIPTNFTNIKDKITAILKGIKEIGVLNNAKVLFSWLKDNFSSISFKNIKQVYVNLDKETAKILLDYIDNNPGVDVDGKISDLAKKFDMFGKQYEAKMEGIGKLANEFEDFIKFFPGVSGSQEKKLQNSLNLARVFPDDVKGFETKFLEVINKELGVSLNLENIRNINAEIGKDIVEINTERLAKIQEKVVNICELSGKTEVQKLAILRELNEELVKNTTFWQPHLSLYLKGLIDLNGIVTPISFEDVLDFKGDSLNYRATFLGYLDKIEGDLIKNNGNSIVEGNSSELKGDLGTKQKPKTSTPETKQNPNFEKLSDREISENMIKHRKVLERLEIELRLVGQSSLADHILEKYDEVNNSGDKNNAIKYLTDNNPIDGDLDSYYSKKYFKSKTIRNLDTLSDGIQKVIRELKITNSSKINVSNFNSKIKATFDTSGFTFKKADIPKLLDRFLK